MAKWWESIPMPALKSDLDAAFEFASELVSRGSTGRQRRQTYNKYFTETETNAYGYFGQFTFQRYIGEEPDLRPADRGQRRPDAAGYYEVKTAPWVQLEHFHLSHGGRLFVPQYTSAPVVVRLSLFLKNMRQVWIDGWVYRRRIVSPVPYDKLLPAASLPHPPTN